MVVDVTLKKLSLTKSQIKIKNLRMNEYIRKGYYPVVTSALYKSYDTWFLLMQLSAG